MHYGVIGVGPVGATFAAMLRASRQRVSLFDKDLKLLTAFREKPLKIKGYYQAQAHFTEVYPCFEDFAAADPEVVLLAVKTIALPAVLSLIKDSALRDKAIVSCQNGIDTEKEIAEALGDDHAFRMVLNFGVSYSPAHEVTVNFLNEPHFLSCVSPSQAALAKKIIFDLNEAGVKVEFLDDITSEEFKKAILNTCLGGVCALTRTTMSEAMGDPDLARMVEDMLCECLSVCRAHKIDLGKDFVDKAMAYLRKGGNHKPSMLVDIENGRQTENRHLAGKLVEYAQRREVAVPVTQSVFYLIKSLEKAVMPKTYEHILAT